MTETVQNFFTLGSLVVIAGLAALAVAGIVQLAGGRALAAAAEWLSGWELALGWMIAALAMAGSLYFSEIADYVPCPLCWYQRIAMYPLVILLGLAAIRRDRRASLYGLVLSLAGAAIAVYHYQLEWFPDQAALCRQGSLCEVIWFRVWGFATIPYLSLVAFLGVAALCSIALANERRARPAPDTRG
jgi:disulfide bond formation protein DsbB